MENRLWTGKWIWHEELKGIPTVNQMVLFRKSFQLEDAGASYMTVHLSADSRYQLFVNGRRVGVGPCKGDRHRQYYETYDITTYLRDGDNTIAVKVLHLIPGRSDNVSGSGAIWRSPWGGFILDGEIADHAGNVQQQIVTDESWQCYHDRSYELVWESWISGKWLGGVERVDGGLKPRDWQDPDYDAHDWPQVYVIGGTMNPWGVLNDWPLEPRPIPFLYEVPKTFTGVVRTGGIQLTAEQAEGLLHGGGAAMTLEPHTSYWVELDASELTTGYLHLELFGGEGSEIRLRCAECYETEDENGDRVKDVRDRHTEEYKLVGDADHYIVAGYGDKHSGRVEHYEPFWWKTFRYVRMEIEVGDMPLSFNQVHYRETGYPLDVQASFSCSDPAYTPLWDISIRTLQRCMHETYEDCPYYEQLQYLMDTALQMQFTYYISGDDRLARRAIHDFHASRLPDGMIQCRYPSTAPQVIPGFSLYWIGMLHDHYMYYGDLELVRTYMPTAEGVVNWFRRLLNADGLVGATPPGYWAYVDWVKTWKNGIPPAGYTGPMTAYSFMFAAALHQFAALNDALGRTSTGEEYRELADRVNTAAKRASWSAENGLFRDGPHTEEYSQHVQLWSVLSGAVEGEEAAALMRRTMARTDLPHVSYCMSYFLFRALSKAGVYELVEPEWNAWHRMVSLNMTTWAEQPAGNRSDCHAWGAVPLYEFPAEILGVKPELPGFERIGIRPHIGHLTHAEGTVMTSKGPVDVKWAVENHVCTIHANGPTATELVLYMPDGTKYSFREGGSVSSACQLPAGGGLR